jgi:hypothetical protein
MKSLEQYKHYKNNRIDSKEKESNRRSEGNKKDKERSGNRTLLVIIIVT